MTPLKEFTVLLTDFKQQTAHYPDQNYRADMWVYCSTLAKPATAQRFPNANLLAQEVFEEWILTQTTFLYVRESPFTPLPQETLWHYLNRCIRTQTHSTYQDRQKRAIIKYAKETLVRGIHFTPQDKKVFFEAHFQGRWGKMKPKAVNSSRHAICNYWCQEILEGVGDRFLTAPEKNYTWGATLLALWVALTSSLFRYRRISIRDILSLRQDALQTGHIKVRGFQMPISHQLFDFLRTFQFSNCIKLLNIDRKTLSNHLYKVLIDLPHIASPVSPETFLEEPHCETGLRSRFSQRLPKTP